MSSRRNIWWPYVQGMMRKYPELAAAQEEKRETPSVEQREYAAVRDALVAAAEKPDGALRLKMVKLVYWDQTHKLFAAAWEVGASERTVRRWNRDILY